MAKTKGLAPKGKIIKSDSEWKRNLSPQQYEITRQHGTEAAFSGIYWDTKTDGVYECICCSTELYTAKAKYDSGTGWPSFWEAIDTAKIVTRTDNSYGMVRTEVLCATCDSHLGHIFDDGPPPTGLRHCLNSASLKLKPFSK